jgi:hypothetical protein
MRPSKMVGLVVVFIALSLISMIFNTIIGGSDLPSMDISDLQLSMASIGNKSYKDNASTFDRTVFQHTSTAITTMSIASDDFGILQTPFTAIIAGPTGSAKCV